MKNFNFLHKEYHPVIEEYITGYADDEIDQVEKLAFEEVMVHDDDIRNLALHAKGGKELLSKFREIKAREGFLDRLLERISEES